MITKRNKKHIKIIKLKTGTKRKIHVRFKQTGGGWEDIVKQGIQDASDHYRTKSKFYHVGPLGLTKYGTMFVNRAQLNILVGAINDQLKIKFNTDLSKVSSNDYEMLRKKTRLFILKQDLREESTYKTLLDNIRNGKLDNDFKKYYKQFGYAKPDDSKEITLFRQSTSKQDIIQYAQKLNNKPKKKKTKHKHHHHHHHKHHHKHSKHKRSKHKRSKSKTRN